MAIPSELRSVGYAFGNLGKNLIWSAADLTLLFILTDLLGMPPGWAGSVMMVALLSDMLIDLCAGRICEYAQRYGIRYHHMLFVLAPICASSFAALYWMAGAEKTNIPGVIAALVAFRITYGLIDIPHNAMLPGIAPDSRSRGRVAGYRYFFSSVATLGVTMLLSPKVGAAGATGNTDGLGLFGLVAAGVAVAAIWIAAATEQKVSDNRSATIGRIPILPPLSRDFVTLLWIGLIAGGLSAMFARSMIYYGTHYLSDPQSAADILSMLVIGQFVGSVLWSWASQRFETARVLAIANLLSALFVLVFAFVPDDMQFATGFLIGVALAGVFALPWALLADIIDADDVHFGKRHEPQAVSFFVTILKAGAALSMAGTGWALAAVDYVGSESQSAAIAATVHFMTVLPPIVGGLLGGWFALRLGNSHAAQADHAHQLATRTQSPQTKSTKPGED